MLENHGRIEFLGGLPEAMHTLMSIATCFLSILAAFVIYIQVIAAQQHNSLAAGFHEVCAIINGVVHVILLIVTGIRFTSILSHSILLTVPDSYQLGV